MTENEHGTYAAYQHHKKRHQKICDACSQFKPKKEEPEHGTYAAYQRHIKRKEGPCEACLQANREYTNTYRKNPESWSREYKQRGQIHRALVLLRKKFPEEYLVCLKEIREEDDAS